MSARARERRVNQGVFVSGMTGAGKGRMAELLASKWRRTIYIDPTRSFEEIDLRATTYAQAKEFLAKRWKSQPFRLAVTFTDDEDYPRFFGGLYNVATAMYGVSDNVCLVLDEIDLWSSPHKIERHVSKLVRYGRHYGVCWIAVCRADVETHRDVRMNATEMILFRQGMLSPEMRRALVSAENVRKEEIAEVATLQLWNKPDTTAEEGRHFVAVPDTFGAWLPTWEGLAKVRESK